MPPDDLAKLVEQKRACAEEMRRVAKTLWLCTDRGRVMKRAAELEAQSKWLVLDAAAAVAALVSTRAERRAEREDKS
jgi:hypothetical protein